MGSGLTVRTSMLLLVPALALLLAAHFFHAGLGPVAAVAILLVALLFAPRAWAARTVQVVLALGALEWVVTAYTLAEMRARHDQPYVRLLVILGVVAVLTALAAMLFQHPLLRARFGLGRHVETPGESSAARR